MERLVDVCGAADPASAFQGRSVDVSCRGMQVRASHLPQLHAPIVVRFHEHGAEVIAEGEVSWRRSGTTGGDFGVRFTALDSRSVQTLKALCGVVGLEEPDAHTQPGGAVAPISTRAPGSMRELDHDTDPAPPAALGVRLHVAGLAAPLQARVKAQVSNRLELGSQLDFLRVGRTLDVEDLAYGGRRTAYVESLDVSVDPKSRVPELVVSVRYAESSDAARASTSRSQTPEPQRARSLARGRGSWEKEVPSQPLPPITPSPMQATPVSSPRSLAASSQPGASTLAGSTLAGSTLAAQSTAALASSPTPGAMSSGSASSRSAAERARTPAPSSAELDLSKAPELGEDDGDGEEERDTTPPPLPLRVDRAESAVAGKKSASSSESSKTSDKLSEKAPEKKPAAAAAPKVDIETDEEDESEQDSTEAMLARLDSLLRGLPDAARAAGEQVVSWGGAASRGASWCLTQARRAMNTSRRPAAPRRRTAAAPRSSLRSGPLRQNSQQAPQRARTEDAADVVRRRGTRTVLYSCLIALVAIGIGWLARPSKQVAPPAAAHVAAAPAPAAPAPTSSVPLSSPTAAGSQLGEPTSAPPPSLLAPRAPSASVVEDDGPLQSAVGSSGRNLLPEESQPSPARGQSVAAGSDEFGQGRLHLPVIYRLRLDEPGGSLRGERTATGFEITIVGRRVLDSANSIAKRDSRIAKVSTQNGAQGTRVSFRFRDEIPAYKVRLRRDSVEFLISSS